MEKNETLEAVCRYCRIDKPTGALLLSGEWGSGKTFFIDSIVAEELLSSHLFIRVSLFGVSSVNELNAMIKKEYINKTASGISHFLNKVPGEFVDKTKAIAAGAMESNVVTRAFTPLLSISFEDFVTVENVIGEKKIVLVFDDFERSTINLKELLGVINEYNENKGFNVIVLANELELNSQCEDAYARFKEKVIRQTVPLRQSYDIVVKNILVSDTKGKYKDFLESNKVDIINLLSDIGTDGVSLDVKAHDRIGKPEAYFGNHQEEREKEKNRKKELLASRPHNIRSIKAAIEEFDIVFNTVSQVQGVSVQRVFFSFICYYMAYKACLVHVSNLYGTVSAYSDLELLYPGYFQGKYLPRTLQQWVDSGLLNKDELNKELLIISERDGALSAYDIVRTRDVINIDEDITRQEFPLLIEAAYKSELSFADYICFIINAARIREYHLNLSVNVDWAKVCQGISRRIERLRQMEVEQDYVPGIKLDKSILNEDEYAAYMLIREYDKENNSMYAVNRREYIDLLGGNDIYAAFRTIRIQRHDCFTKEMSMATFDAYKECTNEDKYIFVEYFIDCFKNYRRDPDYNGHIEETRQELQALLGKLVELRKEYEASNKVFAESATRGFAEKLGLLITEEK